MYSVQKVYLKPGSITTTNLLHTFCPRKLDKFLSELLDNQKEYEEMCVIFRILLTFSHGQGAVERGFSISKEVLAPNLQEMSLTVLRLTHSSLSAKEIKMADFQN